MNPLPSLFIRTALFFVMMLAFGGTVRDAQALSVDNIRLGTHPDKVRMVLDLSRASDYRIFTLADPHRIVIDLPGFEWKIGRINRPPESGISDIRQGALQPDISRIVIDLDRPASIRTAFMLPADQGLPDRLVIDYQLVSTAAYAGQEHKIFGRLDPGSAPTSAVPAVETTSAADAQNVAYSAAPAMIPPPAKPQPAPAPATPVDKPLIVIDPGHGGIDPGAIGANGAFEKNVTLAMARELRSQLEATGRYRVALTRDTDVYLRLGQRVSIAREKNADLFISLHADSINQASVSGASIYTLSEKASDAQTARLADRENRADLIAGVDLTHEDEQVANILVDLAMRDTMNQSKFFANTIVTEMKGGGLRLLENPHRYAGFAVLRAPDIPSVLIELGFMSNRAEADKLASPDHRRRVARIIREGIDAYFAQVRRQNRS